jgi:outer membrane autotransporter protein
MSEEGGPAARRCGPDGRAHIVLQRASDSTHARVACGWPAWLRPAPLCLGVIWLVRCAASTAACSNDAPTSGATVTCDTSAPNPSTTGVQAAPNSTNVTVNVRAGAELDVANNNVVLVFDNSTVNNAGTLRQTTSDEFDAISAQGSGAGHDVLINSGIVTTTGAQSEAMFNSAAGVSMTNAATGSLQTSGANATAMNDFGSPGGGTLLNYGTILTSGTSSNGMAAFTQNDAIINYGTVTTTGANSAGLAATGVITGAGVPNGSGTDTLINNGTINVSGTDSSGMVTLNIDPVTVTNNGQINATGQGGSGVFMNGPATFTNGAKGSIVVSQSNGVIANGGGTLTNAGSINAPGAGIFTGGAATITNSGTIVSSGYIAVQAAGAVNVTINNSGTLSGPVAAIQTDTGNDTFNMTAGSTTGIVNLGGGANAITLTGGTIGNGITTSAGPSDTLLWTGGGTIAGAVTLAGSDNAATLAGLTDANLSSLTALSSGNGTGTLTFNGTQASGASRFSNWTAINLTNGSQLTLDTNGLTLGNAGTGTGTLTIDATSQLMSGGLGDPSITPATAGQFVNVVNAGTIDLTSGGTSTADALVVNGNYVGQNGRLLLQTVLGGDGSPSDRLVIAQGAASGSTVLGVTNLGGAGGATLSNGILVVQATGGATTTAGAFTLPKPLLAGAFTYYLFRGGVTAGSADNWYLRSSLAAAPVAPTAPTTPASPTSPTSPTTPTNPDTGSTAPSAPPSASAVPAVAPQPAPGTPALPAPPPTGSAPVPLYRMEVPVYAEVPELSRELTLEQVGTFHQRQGEQALLTESGALPASWARAWGQHADFATGGGASPSFSGTTAGMQLGQDVYADASASGHRNHYGFLLGFARGEGDVSGLALGFPGYAAGHLSINAYSAGMYWTHVGPSGWYTDALVLGSSLTIDPQSNEAIGATTHGHALAASVEGGLPIALAGGVSVEPQMQLVWQHVSASDLYDGVSTVTFGAQGGAVGRLGVRVADRVGSADTYWLPYLRVNLWRYFGGTDTTTYNGTTVIPSSVAATAAEFALGVAARFAGRGSIYASVGYTTNVGGVRRDVVTGTAGLRWSW